MSDSSRVFEHYLDLQQLFPKKYMKMKLLKPKDTKSEVSLLMKIENESKPNAKAYLDKVIILSDKAIILNKLKKCFSYRRLNPIHQSPPTILYNSTPFIQESLNTKGGFDEDSSEKPRMSYWRAINDSHLKRNISLPPLITRLKDSQPRNERENKKESILIGTKLKFN